MHAISRHKFSLAFLLLTFFVSVDAMEQCSSWPIVTFVHHQAPATFKLGSNSLSVTCGNFYYDHPLKINIDDLSPIQKIYDNLLEKDRAEYKEQDTFVLNKSRAMQFVTQREQIIDICVKCLYGSTTAKLQLLDLSFAIDEEEELSKELNAIFHRYLQTIIEEFFNDEGQLKECNASDYDNAARRIGNMFVEFLPWNQCLPKVESYRDRVPGFEQFYNDIYSKWRFFKGASFALREIYKSLYKSRLNFTERKSLILNNSFNKDLCAIQEAYRQSDDAMAYRIRQKYYDQARGKKSTSDEGSRSFLAKEYCKELVQSIEPVKQLNLIREKYKESPLIQHISLVTESHVKRNAVLGSQLNTVIFLATALHRIPQKKLEKNKNHLDQEYAEAYDTFFDNRGLPVIFKYNEEALASVTIPSFIGNYGRVKERLMLYKLASLCIEPNFIDKKTFTASLSNALQYLCHGLRDVEHSQTYHLLIEALYNALTNTADTSLRDIITCNFLPSEQCEEAVHGIVLDHVRTLLHALDESLSYDQNEFLHNSLKALSRVWAQACSGSKQAEKIISKPSPAAAFIEENFLDHSLDYENALFTSSYLQERMNQLGFNKIITANACAMSAPDLKKIEKRCAVMSKHNEVPNFAAIAAIMHDAHVPKPITTLLHNALELWQMEKQTAHVREIAVTATHCAEVAYGYHKQDDYYYCELFLSIGNGLYKYGCIVGHVVGNKLHSMAQGIADTSKDVVIWSIKSTARKLEFLLDEVQRFTNAISGKGYYLPKDHYKDKIFHERYEEFMRAKQEQAHRELEALAQIAPTSVVFLARVCGADPYDSSSLKVKLTMEAYKALENYINNFIDLSHEEKFKTVIEFALDYYVDNKVFSIASHMCKWLHHGLKEWVELKKLAQAAHEVEFCEHGYQAILQTEEALVGAARKNLNPNVMKSEGAPILSGVKKAVDRISSEIIDYLRHGKEGNVIKELTSEIFIKYERHIFSDKHLGKGIMNLGSTRDTIAEKFANIILGSDKDNFIKAGENTIITQIKGCRVILKVFIKEGKVINVDGFIWDKGNPRLLGNVFTYIMDIYK